MPAANTFTARDLDIPVSSGTLRATLHEPIRAERLPVVLVHGWAGNRRFWTPQAEHLAQNRSVLSVDLAGHGDSAAHHSPWQLQRLAADLVQVLAHIGWPRVILVGHSMGGAVCSEAAALAPGQVRAVILGDTFVFDYGQFGEDDIAGLMQRFSDDLPGAIRQLVHDTTPEGTPGDLRHYIADSMAGTRADAALPLFESLLRWNPLAVWPHVQCPVVAINGDLIHPAARERHAGIITEHLVPGTGHFLQMESPAAFNAAMEKVLTRFG